MALTDWIVEDVKRYAESCGMVELAVELEEQELDGRCIRSFDAGMHGFCYFKVQLVGSALTCVRLTTSREIPRFPALWQKYIHGLLRASLRGS